MELSIYTLFLTAVALFSYLSLVVLTASAVNTIHPWRARSESILIAVLILALILWAQVHVLSVLPINRPLRLLWVTHGASLLLVFGVGRQIGSMPAKWAYCLLKDLIKAFARLPKLYLVYSLLVLTYVALHGAFAFSFNNFDWDGIEYHIPMAIQPYQDGRLGTLGADIPWIDHYPRGIALLWFHTLQLTHANALFLLVQWASGLALALAAFALLRRRDVNRKTAGIAATVVLSMPIFSLFSTSLYIDLPTAFAAVLPVVFLTPSARKQLRTCDFFWAVAAFAAAMQIKLPIIPTLFLFLAICYWAVFAGNAGRNSLRTFFFSWHAPVALLLLVAAAYPYIANLIQFANPLYPLQVALPGGIHLQGPLASSVYELYAKSNFGTMSELGRWGRYPAAWLDLFQRQDVDGFGMNGPVFVFAIIPLFLAFLFAAIAARSPWQLLMAAMGLSVFMLGSLALPRYHIPMAFIAICCAFFWIASLPDKHRHTLQWVIIFFSVFSVFDGLKVIDRGTTWKRQVLGEDYRFLQRASLLPEKYPIGDLMYASPRMTQAIRETSGDGDVLAWNVRTFLALLWNTSYSNRLVHVPSSPYDLFPGNASNFPPLSDVELRAWIEEIKSLNPDQVLVYAASVLASSMKTELGHLFEEVYADPEDSGKVPMILFRRIQH